MHKSRCRHALKVTSETDPSTATPYPGPRFVTAERQKAILWLEAEARQHQTGNKTQMTNKEGHCSLEELA